MRNLRAFVSAHEPHRCHTLKANRVVQVCFPYFRHSPFPNTLRMITLMGAVLRHLRDDNCAMGLTITAIFNPTPLERKQLERATVDANLNSSIKPTPAIDLCYLYCSSLLFDSRTKSNRHDAHRLTEAVTFLSPKS